VPPYAWDKLRADARRVVAAATKDDSAARLEIITPPAGVEADLASPLFGLAKAHGRNPLQFAEEIERAASIVGSPFARVQAQRGYLNFFIDWPAFSTSVFADFAASGDNYGRSEAGDGKTIVIDYSSPNIAKPFSIGHLRSTVIGQSLYNILSYVGYKVVGDNHLGDWGTQFGKLMAAYKRWSDTVTMEATPIKAMLELYVRFHNEAKTNPELERDGRDWFRKLEEGDAEAISLWTWFRELSVREFDRIYTMLGVKFDCVLGESFYNDRLADVVAKAFEKGIAEWAPALVSQKSGAIDEPIKEEEKVALVRLAAYGIPTPLLLQKSDGTSLYATRDIAAIAHRMRTWKPAQVLYVVGGEQKLYFQQCFKVFELLGYDAKCVHVWFGLIRLPEGRMSTREGRVVFLEDVLREAVERAHTVIQDRDMTPDMKDQVARMVGIGAVKYADLSQDRTKDVVFDWNRMLSLGGDSAPYIQYAHTRAVSILRKAGAEALDLQSVVPGQLVDETERHLVKTLARFPEVVELAAADYAPHRVASYLFELAQGFNRFYREVPVLKAEEGSLVATRLKLVDFVRIVIRNGMALLGIECPESM